MFSHKSLFNKLVRGVVVSVCALASQQSFACGGFFCSAVPIVQAGEQIVFRQEGSETTAMIKITYAGNAEDFGWVLPVPETPIISLGSDTIFTELELTTRPQFLLANEGAPCPTTSSSSSSASSSGGTFFSSSSSSSSSGGVVIEQDLSVGAFNAQVVSSDDAQALSVWLADNNLDLTDKGDELLQPYIKAKSKFVVLKLKNNFSTDSIQPVILKYQSSAPVIPMTLTAVATQNNMGVLVWLLGDARGVPENFHHVTPNYTRLNWFQGQQSAYFSYQNLITPAMDEAGGQGFATDFAGYMPDLSKQFTKSTSWVSKLESWKESTDANFISLSWNELNPLVQSYIRGNLPTSNAFVYQDPIEMLQIFSESQLKTARTELLSVIQDQVIAPLDNALDILDDDLYLTRLYTTLSANEMTKNPIFTFNSSMGDQSLTRTATLTASCINEQSHWALRLGVGTGRENELVIESWDYNFGTSAASQQNASWRVEKTSANLSPIVVAKNDFKVLTLGSKKVPAEVPVVDEPVVEEPVVEVPPVKNDPAPTNSDPKKGGAMNGLFMLYFTLSLLGFALRRRF